MELPRQQPDFGRPYLRQLTFTGADGVYPAGQRFLTAAARCGLPPASPCPPMQVPSTCENQVTSLRIPGTMTSQKYDFRQFQEELAKLEQKVEKQKPAKPLSKKEAAAQRLALAREEFLDLRKRHELTVADVVAFFPEEEGIAYLQELIAAAQAKPRRTRKA